MWRREGGRDRGRVRVCLIISSLEDEREARKASCGERKGDGGELKGAAGAAGNADDAFAVVVKFCSARKDIMCDAAAFFAAFKAFSPGTEARAFSE